MRPSRSRAWISRARAGSDVSASIDRRAVDCQRVYERQTTEQRKRLEDDLKDVIRNTSGLLVDKLAIVIVDEHGEVSKTIDRSTLAASSPSAAVTA